jgi:hypothetical protein
MSCCRERGLSRDGTQPKESHAKYRGQQQPPVDGDLAAGLEVLGAGVGLRGTKAAALLDVDAARARMMVGSRGSMVRCFDGEAGFMQLYPLKRLTFVSWPRKLTLGVAPPGAEAPVVYGDGRRLTAGGCSSRRRRRRPPVLLFVGVTIRCGGVGPIGKPGTTPASCAGGLKPVGA